MGRKKKRRMSEETKEKIRQKAIERAERKREPKEEVNLGKFDSKVDVRIQLADFLGQK